MIDFTNCKKSMDHYSGANGSKIGVIYEGDRYMLKFPTAGKLNKDMHYTNGCISEYLACHIYNSIGVDVQETELGIFRKPNGGIWGVVACKDFTDPAHGIMFQDFGSIKNSIIDSEHHGYGTDLDEILQTIDEQQYIDPDTLRERFWDMYVVDEFIGNPDRHNGNWGFLCDYQRGTYSLAPVYDCGSSLLPQAGEDHIQDMLHSKSEINIRIYERITSAICMNGKRINYATFNQLHMQDYPDYGRALARIESRINMEKIGEIIDNTPVISDLHKEFYKTLLTERKQQLLDKATTKAMAFGQIGCVPIDKSRIPGAHCYETDMLHSVQEQGVIPVRHKTLEERIAEAGKEMNYSIETNREPDGLEI